MAMQLYYGNYGGQIHNLLQCATISNYKAYGIGIFYPFFSYLCLRHEILFPYKYYHLPRYGYIRYSLVGIGCDKEVLSHK